MAPDDIKRECEHAKGNLCFTLERVRIVANDCLMMLRNQHELKAEQLASPMESFVESVVDAIYMHGQYTKLNELVIKREEADGTRSV
jgi:hypothetical protein